VNPPLAASCRANSRPIPDDAPVTTAQGPNFSLSTNVLIVFRCSVILN
jgi:hypothetical protein